MNKIHLSINYSQLMRRVFLAYRIALILLLLAALFLPHAFAVEEYVNRRKPHYQRRLHQNRRRIHSARRSDVRCCSHRRKKCPARSRKQIRLGTGLNVSGSRGSLSTALELLSPMFVRCSTVWLR